MGKASAGQEGWEKPSVSQRPEKALGHSGMVGKVLGQLRRVGEPLGWSGRSEKALGLSGRVGEAFSCSVGKGGKP